MNQILRNTIFAIPYNWDLYEYGMYVYNLRWKISEM